MVALGFHGHFICLVHEVSASIACSGQDPLRQRLRREAPAHRVKVSRLQFGCMTFDWYKSLFVHSHVIRLFLPT